nr:MAG TPA: hypothetical protein [Bacteriophage sp.]
MPTSSLVISKIGFFTEDFNFNRSCTMGLVIISDIAASIRFSFYKASSTLVLIPSFIRSLILISESA